MPRENNGVCMRCGVDREGVQRCTLGRQDSNLGMAESKSDHFLHLINAHSEKFEKYAFNPINKLHPNSECRHEHSTSNQTVMNEVQSSDDPTKYLSVHLATYVLVQYQHFIGETLVELLTTSGASAESSRSNLGGGSETDLQHSPRGPS